jgi:predicted oxidoreductase
VLANVARRYNASPSAVALAWLLRHPADIVPIVGPTKTDHLTDNCAADAITLSREEWYDLLIAATGVPPLQLLELVIPKHWL